MSSLGGGDPYKSGSNVLTSARQKTDKAKKCCVIVTGN